MQCLIKMSLYEQKDTSLPLPVFTSGIEFVASLLIVSLRLFSQTSEAPLEMVS